MMFPSLKVNEQVQTASVGTNIYTK